MRAFLVFCILFLVHSGYSQSSFPLVHDQFKLNNLGQFQVVQENTIGLYSKDGELIKQHSEHFLSEMSHLDRTSALRLLIFYKDIPAFQLLDNTLTPHSQVIDLNDRDLGNLTHLCVSTNNSYWGYDRSSLELIRLDENLELISRSGNLSVLVGEVIEPVQIMEHGGRVYMADAKATVLIFDQFGTFFKRIQFSALHDMDIHDGFIYSLAEGRIERSSMDGLIFEESILDSIDFPTGMDIWNGRIYLGNGKMIQSYTLDSLFD